MGDISYKFALSLSIIILGYIAKKAGIVSEKDGKGLSRIVFNFTLPAVIIDTFKDIEVNNALLFLIFISLTFGLIMLALALYLFRSEGCQMRGMLSMPLLGLNIGLFAYPLVEAIWDRDIIKYFGLLDIGNAFIIFVVCYSAGGYFACGNNRADLKTLASNVFKSIPLISYMLTLVLSLARLSYPKLMLDLAGVFARANAPLSLLTLGVFLTFSFDKRYFKKVFRVVLIKYAAGFVIGGIFYIILPLDIVIRQVIFMSMILPSSLSIIPYSVKFNYDTRFVGTITNITIIISVVLMYLMAFWMRGTA